jgi:F-type H+-transporting ATPase subunit b
MMLAILLASAAAHEDKGSLVSVNPGLAIWTLVTFLLVAAVLRWKVWGPLMHVIEEREKGIADAVEQAKREREQAERLLAEQQAAIQEARKEAAALIAKNRAEVDAAKAELIAKAKAEADALLAAAKKSIDDEKRKALAEVRAVAVDLALQAAGKVVAAKMDDAQNRALAEEFIKSVGPRPAA